MAHTPWAVISGVRDPVMYAVKGVYLVADYLPIEDAILIAAAPTMIDAINQTINSLEAEYGPNKAGINFPHLYIARAKAEGRSND